MTSGAEQLPQRTWITVELGSEEEPALLRWTTWYPPSETGRGGSMFESYALRTRSGPVLVDPDRPSPDDELRVYALIEAMGAAPLASILTNDMHERGAYAAREDYGVPVWAPADDRAAYLGRPDRFYHDGETLPGGVRAVRIDGPFPGDTCLLGTAADGTRVLFSGDMLLGRRNAFDPRGERPRGTGPGGALSLHGTGPQYRGCRDAAQFRASLRQLLDRDVDVVCPAHGTPVHAGASLEIARLLGP